MNMHIPVDQQNIIRALGLESLPDDKKLELIAQVSDVVEKRILLRVLESFTPEQRKELDGLLDVENQQGVNEFMQKNAPQIPAWIEEELAHTKQELAELPAVD